MIHQKKGECIFYNAVSALHNTRATCDIYMQICNPSPHPRTTVTRCYLRKEVYATFEQGNTIEKKNTFEMDDICIKYCI